LTENIGGISQSLDVLFNLLFTDYPIICDYTTRYIERVIK